jgi:hypothetical protein
MWSTRMDGGLPQDLANPGACGQPSTGVSSSGQLECTYEPIIQYVACPLSKSESGRPGAILSESR